VDFFSYQKLFEAKLSGLKLPDDCVAHEPAWEVTMAPYFWTVEAFFQFVNRKHVRLWESHAKFAGLQESRKIQWAYHYGPTQSSDEAAELEQGAPDDPVDIRIDTCSGLHLHYGTREPHYDQSRIVGLKLDEIQAWDFVRAVLKHRKSGEKLAAILRFKIV
jgi:hypothetical protein